VPQAAASLLIIWESPTTAVHGVIDLQVRSALPVAQTKMRTRA
jgi:hypothetical protein